MDWAGFSARFRQDVYLSQPFPFDIIPIAGNSFLSRAGGEPFSRNVFGFAGSMGVTGQ